MTQLPDQRAVSAVVEYYCAWDQVRRITSELRTRVCEFEEHGDEYTSGTPPCYHDNKTLNEDGKPRLEEWCESCVAGRALFLKRKELTKAMRLKLQVIQRLGTRLAESKEPL